jgi:AcrR family transcriptional regulator
VEAAAELVDAQGFEALSLSAVAAALNVRPSALYNHVESLDDLRSRVAVSATDRLAASIQAAAVGVAGVAALRAVADAYRNFALEHPGQYSAMLRSSPTTEELTLANDRLHDVFVSVYTGAGLAGDDAQYAARQARQAVHGYVTLQHAGAAGDAQFEGLVDGFRAGLVPPAAS